MFAVIAFAFVNLINRLTVLVVKQHPDTYTSIIGDERFGSTDLDRNLSKAIGCAIIFHEHTYTHTYTHQKRCVDDAGVY